jgi:D-sedoheptulose 7-phosphate isomerase
LPNVNVLRLSKMSAQIEEIRAQLRESAAVRERFSQTLLELTTNTSILTAAGNDFGIESIFSRQIESIVASGDVLVALSTSGSSVNIVRGVEVGRGRGAFLVALTGETGGELRDMVDLLINVPSRDAQRIQEAHITVGHIVCSLIEKSCCPELDDLK